MLKGKKVARRALAVLGKVTRFRGSLGSFGNDVGKLGLRLQLMKVAPKFFQLDGYCVAEERVLVVRLGGKGEVDHVVCVDLWRGLIFDIEDRHPLRLTPESLHLCAGTTSGVKIGEVRNVAIFITSNK